MEFVNFKITLDHITITLSTWWLLIGFLFILWMMFGKKWKWKKRKVYEISTLELGIGNQKIILKPNVLDQQIAYKIWVELSTRKAGLPIDENTDVIIEIYNSWYSLFGIIRELMKDIPISKICTKGESEKLVELIINVLNKGIRPHLTKWQAQFRKWYENASLKDENKEKTPQELQKEFPKYNELFADLKETNKHLIYLSEQMKKIAFLMA